MISGIVTASGFYVHMIAAGISLCTQTSSNYRLIAREFARVICYAWSLHRLTTLPTLMRGVGVHICILAHKICNSVVFLSVDKEAGGNTDIKG